MKRWKLLLINGDDPEQGLEDDEYEIADGCCYFHNQKELDEFSNVDDDKLVEA